MKKIYYDKWEKNKEEGGTIEVSENNFQELEKLLKRLDEKKFTQLIIKGNNDYMVIGGGNNKYLCSFIIGFDEQAYNLINNNYVKDFNEIEIVTGGQAGLFPKRLCNNYEAVLKAVFFYIRNNKMDASLNWKLDY